MPGIPQWLTARQEAAVRTLFLHLGLDPFQPSSTLLLGDSSCPSNPNLLVPLLIEAQCLPLAFGTNSDPEGVVVLCHRLGISDRKVSSLLSLYSVVPKFLQMLLNFCKEGG